MSAGPESGGLPNLTLPGGEVDRATARRRDTEWLAAAWADPRTRVLVVDEGKALIRSGDGREELVFVPPSLTPDGVRFLLGIDVDGVVYFGVAGPLPDANAAGVPGSEIRSASLRQAGPQLSERDVGLMFHAVALSNWHAVHGHCPRCGAVTEPNGRVTRGAAWWTAASTSRGWTRR